MIASLLTEISLVVHDLIAQQFEILNEEIFPQLSNQGISILPATAWTNEQRQWLYQYFREQVLPLLSPIALDPAHPFPRLINKGLNFILSLSGKDAFGRDCDKAVVHAPRQLERIIRLPSNLVEADYGFVYLTHVIASFVNKLFPGMQVNGCYHFRIVRNSELSLNIDKVEDLSQALESELFARHYGHAIRMDMSWDCPSDLYEFLLQHHQLQAQDLYLVPGQVNLSRCKVLLDLVNSRHCRFSRVCAFATTSVTAVRLKCLRRLQKKMC